MKSVIVATIISSVLATASASTPAISYYIDVQNVYQYSIGGVINYTHNYDFSVSPPLAAILTIVADDVDGPGNGLDGEQDEVWLRSGASGSWNYLGMLEDMGFYSDFAYQPGPGNANQPLTTTVFSLDPAWLDAALPIEVRVESAWGVEIETSTLEVTTIPEPTTLTLLGLGWLALVMLRRRR